MCRWPKTVLKYCKAAVMPVKSRPEICIQLQAYYDKRPLIKSLLLFQNNPYQNIETCGLTSIKTILMSHIEVRLYYFEYYC